MHFRFFDASTDPLQVSAAELYWMPANPAWNESLQAVGDVGDERSWTALVALANSRADLLATIRLDRRLTRLFPAPPAWLSTIPVRLAVLASSTMDHLLPALRVGALRRGIHLSIHAGDYGQYLQDLMDSGSGLHRYKPDAVLFAMDANHLLGRLDAGDSDEIARAKLDAVCDSIVTQWRLARNAFGAKLIQQTVLPVFPQMFGNNEQRLPGSRARAVRVLNDRLRDLADANGADLLAIDSQIGRDGIRAWHDPVLWHRAKQEIHPSAAPAYGDLLGRLLAAYQGRSRKCLVLDLDNTLWGGVIGDDGLNGIVLGQGSALGEAFLAFQDSARALSRRGVILAVCSKNDEANALEPFERHPEMALKRTDIACFVANWADKASNIRDIATRLNIGIDSLVFVDDNPFERDLVRKELPMVAVPELPEDPALWAACLADAGYFEGVNLTAEDLARAQQYQTNLERESLKSAATDMDAYLRGLNMQMWWGRFDAISLQRVVQLINKTNQFNLTTRRTTEAAVSAIIEDERALSLQLRLTDSFGDNGIIAIVIGLFEGAGHDLAIDTWLMSCRVLGRRVEEATLNVIVAEARRLGARRLIGEYRPSEKNGMVRDHYARLGFQPLDESGGEITRWELSLDAFNPMPTPIAMIPDISGRT